MRILVTNDDGVHAEGLWKLAAALRDVGRVSVVAPDRDLSGIGTAVTFRNAVRVHEIASPVAGVDAISVEGTPADCVVLATAALFTEPFDLIFSGINPGSNTGRDVLTSGTVGGALQGHYRDIPSVAVSVWSLTGLNYETASRTASAIARSLARDPLPGSPLLNVNVPNVEPEKIQKVEITRLGPRVFAENVERAHDGRRTYYWIKHDRPVANHPSEGTDIRALQQSRISITPIDITPAEGVPPVSLEALADEVRSALGVG
jgi:5'-nucleotidase